MLSPMATGLTEVALPTQPDLSLGSHDHCSRGRSGGGSLSPQILILVVFLHPDYTFVILLLMFQDLGLHTISYTFSRNSTYLIAFFFYVGSQAC